MFHFGENKIFAGGLITTTEQSKGKACYIKVGDTDSLSGIFQSLLIKVVPSDSTGTLIMNE